MNEYDDELEAMDILDNYAFVHEDIKSAWASAILAYNGFDNAGMADGATAMGEIIARLSQQLHFCEIMMAMRERPETTEVE